MEKYAESNGISNFSVVEITQVSSNIMNIVYDSWILQLLKTLQNTHANQSLRLISKQNLLCCMILHARFLITYMVL